MVTVSVYVRVNAFSAYSYLLITLLKILHER